MRLCIVECNDPISNLPTKIYLPGCPGRGSCQTYSGTLAWFWPSQSQSGSPIFWSRSCLYNQSPVKTIKKVVILVFNYDTFKNSCNSILNGSIRFPVALAFIAWFSFSAKKTGLFPAHFTVEKRIHNKESIYIENGIKRPASVLLLKA